MTMIRSPRSRSVYCLILAAVALWRLLPLSPFLRTEATAQERVKWEIGAILPLTGVRSDVGVAAKNGIELSLEELDPAVRARINLHFEDDQSKPAGMMAAFHKLRRTHQISIVFAVGSSAGSVLAPLAESERVVLMLLGTNEGILVGRSTANLIRPSLGALAQAMFDECLRRGYKRVAEVTATHESRLLLSEAFAKLAAGKIEIVYKKEIAQSETDLRTTALKLKAVSNLDAVFLNLYLGQISSFARHTRELNLNKPLFNSEYFGVASEKAAAKGALCGQWYVDAPPPRPEFIKTHLQRFGEEPGTGATSGYDFVQIVSAALLADVKEVEFAGYIRSLRDFSGQLGHYSANGDGTFSFKAVVQTVECPED